MKKLEIDTLKKIHGGSNENLNGVKSWLGKQHDKLWESVGAGMAQQGNAEAWKHKTLG
ncbi:MULTISPECIES: hypothetical protein [Staphylococcus]|jgi:hypothetical protein|uniref:hypothetical protein n=1 Tax=Staphylococcus epidermidis TaxID=1282 RepID=UPI00024E17B2|nr:hypothetical protein [Staphylococcus epidermidis]EIJ6033459.1 hypothetical protein [Acinetobacter baumannii]EHR96428.1 hypothetical protein SEVCU126_2324 [Staphylococcus epidermidis VCU126]MCH1562185.1 hypothetical protein [Staphylococcus epidermidis]MCT2328551.1 hypothetical protein [Staphylococcus epidermidis]MDU1009490.1 hypothetical protein [Staphylococcus epidermidis]